MSKAELINQKDVRAQNKNHDEHNNDPLSHLLPGGKADHSQAPEKKSGSSLPK